jgi:hypothetical protein
MIWLKTRLALALSALTGFLVLLGVVYGKGRKDANETRDRRETRDKNETRQRIDQVVRDNDSADSRDWLRERGKR